LEWCDVRPPQVSRYPLDGGEVATDMTPVPYLAGVSIVPDRIGQGSAYPFTLPFVRDLNLRFESPVTFFVGENGTGKSTLIEAIASLCRLPVSGGGRNELAGRHGPDTVSPLAPALRQSFRRRPPDAYFLRAEFQAHFASLLDARRDDPEFIGDPYGRYGGQSLHTRSHGEAFLAILEHRLRAGMFLLDEPESALSPQRQLVLLAHIWNRVSAGKSQFIVATHSPILLTFPGADLVMFDGRTLARVTLEETSHYQITRGILHNAESYWKHLRVVDDQPSASSNEPLQPTSRGQRLGRQRRKSRAARG
jgi:predicted ATPase